MVKSGGPSQYMRKAIKENVKEENVMYNVYGILYDDDIKQRSVAFVAAKTDEDAIGMLEKALVEGRGYEHMKGKLNANVTDMGVKVSKELIFALDRCSNSIIL